MYQILFVHCSYCEEYSTNVQNVAERLKMHVAKPFQFIFDLAELHEAKWYLNCALSHTIHILEQIIQQKTHKSGSSRRFQGGKVPSALLRGSHPHWRRNKSLHQGTRSPGSWQRGCGSFATAGKRRPAPSYRADQ